MFSNIISGLKAAAGSFTHPDANDAPAQSPSRDSPPRPSSRDSPPTSDSTPIVIDLLSPTKPSKQSQHEKQNSKTIVSRSSKRAISEDEKRLTGDYRKPADATLIPDPLYWMPESQNMLPKPGANKGYKPVDTLNNVPRTKSRKPTTYGKHARPRSTLIGQSPGPGQTAYSEFQRSRAPTTPGRHTFFRDEEDLWTGGSASAKRRKTDHVVTLDEDEDEDDIVFVASQDGTSAPSRKSHERPISSKSSQSRLSVGSGSAGADFRPHQVTNEFREVEGLFRNKHKKPRQPSDNKFPSHRQISPFGDGSMSVDAHMFILQDFQQGEPAHRPIKHEQHGSIGQPLTSKYFPKARINESITEQPRASQTVTGNSANLRTQHRPVPKEPGRAEDSDSADELAISPTSRKQIRSPQAKKVAHSSIKKNGPSRESSVSWPLSFARSHDFDGTGSKMEDGHATLILRRDPEGLRVQKYDTEGYQTVMLIPSQCVNKVHAGETNCIRLEGPRDADGNIHIFDLEFLNLPDFLAFRNTHAASLTTKGRVLEKEDEHMRKLFAKPLRLRNEKAKTPQVLGDDAQSSKNQSARHEQVEKQPSCRVRRSERGAEDTSAPNTKTGVTVSTRTTRTRPSPPTQILDDGLDISEVSKYSIDTGLGRPWAKALEYGEGRQRAIVHFDDLPRLDEEEYLNDSLIDFYMIYLFQKLQVPADKVYFFNTYFFTRLTENTGRKSINYKAVERWTSKIDIFSYDYIVVPINESQAHWYLAIICNVSNIQRKPVLEDFHEPQTHIQEHSETCTTPTVASESEEHTKLPLISNPNSPARVKQIHSQPEEDPNLFEEATISLVGCGDAGVRAGSSTRADEANITSLESETEPKEVSQAVADVETTSEGRLMQPTLSFTKSKNKRKVVPKRDPLQPVVVVLDSLGGVARSGAVRTLKDWIAAEGKSKRGMEAVIKENGYYPRGSQIPMQKNWTDCGVYLLGYVEKFFQNPDEFMHKLLTGSMSAKEDWPELKPSRIRGKMRDIIFECYKKQEQARKAQKKAKNEPAKPGTSSDPAPKLPTDIGPVAQPSGDVPVVMSPKAKPEKQREQDSNQAKPHILPPRLRLGSPFEPKKENKASAKQSSREVAAKEADVPAPIGSSVETASTTPSDTPPRRHSSEIGVSTTAFQSHESIDGTHTDAIRSPGQDERVDQEGSRPPSHNKRRRQDNDGHPRGSPDAKRSHKNPSRAEGEDSVQTKVPALYSREGSAPNVPIEIEDSQEVEIIKPERRTRAQPGTLAFDASPSPLLRPTLAFDSSSSLEEVSQMPLKAETERCRERELSEHARRSRAPEPSMPSQASRDREGGGQDLVEFISQSTDQMQLDESENGGAIRETPENDRTSPTPS